jgi:hypothetical protein
LFIVLNNIHLTPLLTIFIHISIDDAPKKVKLTQSQKRRNRKAEKDNERSSDMTNVRGYSTDQRISIEHMNVSIRRLEHQQKESKLVGLSIQVSAIGTQIASAEARAIQRCPQYDPTNIYWKRVDQLIEQETEVVFTMNKYNNDLLIDDHKLKDGPQISSFLNQASPVKTSKTTKKSIKSNTDSPIYELDTNNSDDDWEGNLKNVFDIEEPKVMKNTNDKVCNDKAKTRNDNIVDDESDDVDDNEMNKIVNAECVREGQDNSKEKKSDDSESDDEVKVIADKGNTNNKRKNETNSIGYKVKKEKLSRAKKLNKVSGRTTRSNRRSR